MLDPDCVEMPPALLQNTVLQPVDKIVLLLVMMITRQSTGDAFLPTQAQLARMANASSADTIWRALLILRCSHWLTSCQKMWTKRGLIEPGAYLANAEPLPFADTLFLDPQIEDGLPEFVGKIGVAVSPANPECVYAIIEAEEGGLFRSDDGGHILVARASQVWNRECRFPRPQKKAAYRPDNEPWRAVCSASGRPQRPKKYRTLLHTGCNQNRATCLTFTAAPSLVSGTD